MSLKVGDAGYRILGPIASGGMGEVYKAEHVITKRIEAIKLLSGAGTDEDTDRFLREIQLQASLSHPNIAAVYNAFRVGDDLVMVMEMVEGEPLRAILARGRLPLPVALNYACQVLHAIAYAHANGVIHRDISPSNIVVTGQGSLKLTDFGLAKGPASPSGSQAGNPMGSPFYMSPEQVRDAAQASARSDIYSLGAVLYEMVTGRPVFEGQSSFAVMQAQVERAPLPPIQLEPRLPSALNAAILQALEKDPQRRFATATAFREAIEQAVRRPVPPPPPVRPPRRSGPIHAIQFAATCALVLLPTAYFAGSRHARPPAKVDPPIVQVQPPPPPAVVSVPPAAAQPYPASRPVIRRSRAPREPQSNLTPVILGEQPASPVSPKPRPGKETPPDHVASAAAPPALAPEPAPVPAEPSPAPLAAAPPADPDDQPQLAAADPTADPAKEKKPRSRFRRALSKIFGR